MCLYPHNTKPLVSEKDLIVYKELTVKDRQLFTPYQDTPVNYCDNMVADGEMPTFSEEDYKIEVGPGMVHSYLYLETGKLMYYEKSLFSRTLYVKAVIKAGTPFFVSFDGTSIASRELELTDVCGKTIEIIKNLRKTREEIYNLLREQQVAENGARVGDILLSDKTYCEPDKVPNKQEAIGIVAFIRNGKPYAMSLEDKRMAWRNGYVSQVVGRVLASNEVSTDFNGKDYTVKLYENNFQEISNLPALKYCIRYFTDGTCKGDWYLPSTGEMIRAIRNALIINRSLEKLGRGSRIKYLTHYWTSAEFLGSSAWLCSTSFASFGYYAKEEFAHVRPFLSMP